MNLLRALEAALAGRSPRHLQGWVLARGLRRRPLRLLRRRRLRLRVGQRLRSLVRARVLLRGLRAAVLLHLQL